MNTPEIQAAIDLLAANNIKITKSRAPKKKVIDTIIEYFAAYDIVITPHKSGKELQSFDSLVSLDKIEKLLAFL